jgi:uncharacterized protein
MNVDSWGLEQKLTEPEPFLDLFTEMREAGMQLTLKHYDLLQKGLWRGVASWQDLQRLCAILWVKPSDNYDRQTFEQVFRQYQQTCQEIVVELSEDQPMPVELVPIATREMPQVPVRLMPERYQPSKFLGPIGIQTPTAQGKLSGESWQFTPIALPISIAQFQSTWRRLKSLQPSNYSDEIDIERTKEAIARQGIFADVVLKSSGQQQSELVIFVDEKAGMLPYFPALQPLFRAITGGWVSPARLYRFTGYPCKFLYSWATPHSAIGLDGIMARLHRSRSIVLIISDGGAASGADNPDRVLGTAKFLDLLQSCVSQILWINPMPEPRWRGTPAEEIRDLLEGRMVTLDALVGVKQHQLAQGWMSSLPVGEE